MNDNDKKELFAKTKDHEKQFTATGYTVNKSHDKILLIHHNKLNKWLPAGGHVESDEAPHEAAIREVYEETGVHATLIATDDPDLQLKNIADTQIPRPYAFMYQIIPANKKDVEHIHLDMVYVLEADENQTTALQAKEVKDLQWFTKQEVLAMSDVFDSVKGFAGSFLEE